MESDSVANLKTTIGEDLTASEIGAESSLDAQLHHTSIVLPGSQYFRVSKYTPSFDESICRVWSSNLGILSVAIFLPVIDTTLVLLGSSF